MSDSTSKLDLATEVEDRLMGFATLVATISDGLRELDRIARLLHYASLNAKILSAQSGEGEQAFSALATEFQRLAGQSATQVKAVVEASNDAKMNSVELMGSIGVLRDLLEEG